MRLLSGLALVSSLLIVAFAVARAQAPPGPPGGGGGGQLPPGGQIFEQQVRIHLSYCEGGTLVPSSAVFKLRRKKTGANTMVIELDN